MAWIKLDDQWMEHPKIIRAGRDARDVWLASITWCAKYSTDGYFPENLIPSLAAIAGVDVAKSKQIASTLLDVCLWDATENGYHVHDYLHYNPSKEEVKAIREKRKQAGQAGGLAKSENYSKSLANSLANATANAYQNPAPSPSPINTHNASGGFESAENPTAYRIVTELTGWMAVPPSEENRDFMRDIPTIMQRQGNSREKTLEYLRTFWETYKERYRGSTRLAWIGWALTGEVPKEKKRANSNGHKPAVTLNPDGTMG